MHWQFDLVVKTHDVFAHNATGHTQALNNFSNKHPWFCSFTGDGPENASTTGGIPGDDSCNKRSFINMEDTKVEAALADSGVIALGPPPVPSDLVTAMAEAEIRKGKHTGKVTFRRFKRVCCARACMRVCCHRARALMLQSSVTMCLHLRLGLCSQKSCLSPSRNGRPGV